MTIEYDGKTLYEVEVTETKTLSIYVLAENELDAADDAKEMSHDMFRNGECDTHDVDTWTQTVKAGRELKDFEMIWTGGADGKDVSWKQLQDMIVAEPSAAVFDPNQTALDV